MTKVFQRVQLGKYPLNIQLPKWRKLNFAFWWRFGWVHFLNCPSNDIPIEKLLFFDSGLVGQIKAMGMFFTCEISANCIHLLAFIVWWYDITIMHERDTFFDCFWIWRETLKRALINKRYQSWKRDYFLPSAHPTGKKTLLFFLITCNNSALRC